METDEVTDVTCKPALRAGTLLKGVELFQIIIRLVALGNLVLWVDLQDELMLLVEPSVDREGNRDEERIAGPEGRKAAKSWRLAGNCQIGEDPTGRPFRPKKWIERLGWKQSD